MCCVCRSETVLGPLVEDKTDVAWVAWLKHVEYYKLLSAEEIKVEDIATLDTLIYEAQVAFSKARDPAAMRAHLHALPCNTHAHRPVTCTRCPVTRTLTALLHAHAAL